MHCSFLPSENFLGKKSKCFGDERILLFVFSLQQFIEFTQEPPLGIKSRLHLVSSTFSGQNHQLVSSPPFFSPSHQSNMHTNMYLYIFFPFKSKGVFLLYSKAIAFPREGGPTLFNFSRSSFHFRSLTHVSLTSLSLWRFFPMSI